MFAKKAWLSALPVQAAAADVGDAEGMADEDADGTSDGAAESDAEADSDADGSSVISTVGLGVGLSVGVALAVADGVGVETAAWVAVPVLQAAAMRHAVRATKKIWAPDLLFVICGDSIARVAAATPTTLSRRQTVGGRRWWRELAKRWVPVGRKADKPRPAGMRSRNCLSRGNGGRYWTRTSDLADVNRAL